jgi:hypothetical protein
MARKSSTYHSGYASYFLAISSSSLGSCLVTLFIFLGALSTLLRYLRVEFLLYIIYIKSTIMRFTDLRQQFKSLLLVLLILIVHAFVTRKQCYAAPSEFHKNASALSHHLALEGCGTLLESISVDDQAIIDKVNAGEIQNIPSSLAASASLALRKGVLAKTVSPSTFATATLVLGARQQLAPYSVQKPHREVIVDSNGELTATGVILLNGALNRLARFFFFDQKSYPGNTTFRNDLFEKITQRFITNLKDKSLLDRSVWTFSFSRESFASDINSRRESLKANHPLMMLRTEAPELPIWDENWYPSNFYEVDKLAGSDSPTISLHVLSFAGLQAYIDAVYTKDALQLIPAEGVVFKQNIDRSLQTRVVGLIPFDTKPDSTAHGQLNGEFAFPMHDVLHALWGSRVSRGTRATLARIAVLMPSRDYSPYRSDFFDFDFPQVHKNFFDHLKFLDPDSYLNIEQRIAHELNSIFGYHAIVYKTLLKDLDENASYYRDHNIQPDRLIDSIRLKVGHLIKP